MYNFIRLFSTGFFAIILFSLSGCVDLTFDEPPLEGEDPGLTANTTIAQLKARLVPPASFAAIEDEVIIKGVVVADDRSGNFYQNFILQDETGGIEVRHSIANAYNFFPIGREIFIKCKGLVLGNNNGITQLGGYTYSENGAIRLGNIVNTSASIFRGKKGVEPAPKVKALNALTAGDISTLVKFENVEFAPVDTAEYYADAAGQRTLNRTLQDCNGNTITVRTSATVAALSAYGETKELDDGRVSIKVAADAVPRITAQILAHHDVSDIAVLEPPIEDIIAEVYTR